MNQDIFGNYRTVYGEVHLHQEPHLNAPKVGLIPADTIVEAIDQNQHRIKVIGYEGWTVTTMMERIMDEPTPDIRCHTNGHIIIDGIYRNFFGFQNVGTREYTHQLTMRFYNKHRLICMTVHDCAMQPHGGLLEIKFQFHIGSITRPE